MSTESVMLSNHLILCLPLLFLPSISPCWCGERVLFNEWALDIRRPKYWSFSFSISPLISFRIDWFDLLAVQETLKNLLQHHNSKASIFWCSAFLCPKSYICTWLLNKPWLWLYGPLLAKWCLCFLICWLGRTDAKAETPILWPPHVKSWLIGKDPDAGRDWGQEEKGTTEDEMAGWHHQLNGHEFE